MRRVVSRIRAGLVLSAAVLVASFGCAWNGLPASGGSDHVGVQSHPDESGDVFAKRELLLAEMRARESARARRAGESVLSLERMAARRQGQATRFSLAQLAAHRQELAARADRQVQAQVRQVLQDVLDRQQGSVQ